MTPNDTAPSNFARRLCLAGLAAVALLLPARAHATFGFTITPPQTISWDAVTDPSSTTAKVTYLVLSRFGFTDPLQGGTTVATIFDKTTIVFGSKITGSLCMVVKASTTVSGVFDTSFTKCHSYLHGSGANINDSFVLRADGAGGQTGFNQQWTFTYLLDRDSEMTMTIYPPGTQFSLDANGFSFPPAGVAVTKKVLERTPRTGELDAAITNVELWDSRDSSNAVVPNGIYFVHFIASNPLLTPNVRYADVFTLPVDIIRFTQFTTIGISAGGSVAQINYQITGDASVRIVIAKPGRKFTLDGNGDVQSFNAAGTAIDTSTDSVVQVITFNKRAGTYSDTWNGTDQSGVAVSSGIYAVGLSAKDGFGNQALSLSNDGGLLAGTIPVDRTASQVAGDITPPTITAVAVQGNAISLAGGTTLTSTFTTITITLNETAGTGAQLSQVALSGPGGAIPGGVVTSAGNVITYSTATSQTSTGTYTVTITARDTIGNGTSATPIPFSIIGDTTAPSVSIISVNGSSIALSGTATQFPIGTTFSTVTITLTETSGLAGNISTVTMTGPLGAVSGGSLTISGVILNFTVGTQSTGTYTLAISPRDGSGNAGTQVFHSFAILGDTTTPTVSIVSINGSSVALTGAATTFPFGTTFSTITVTLSEEAAVGANISTVTLSGPSGAITGGSLTVNAGIINFTVAAQNAVGTYTINISPRDPSGNAGTQVSRTFTIQPAGPSTQTSEGFKASVKPYPNPARTAPMAIDFALGSAATVDFDFYTILGERVYHETVTYSAGGTQTFNWRMVNGGNTRLASGVYILRITANEGTQVLKASRKIMVIQ